MRFLSAQNEFLQCCFVVIALEVNTRSARNSQQGVEPDTRQANVRKSKVQVFTAPMLDSERQRRATHKDEACQRRLVGWSLRKRQAFSVAGGSKAESLLDVAQDTNDGVASANYFASVVALQDRKSTRLNSSHRL